MTNKVLYYMGLMSEGVFLIMMFVLLPTILDTGIIGFVFLGITFVYIIMNLFSLLKKKNIIENSKSYSILNIALTFYMGIIFTRIMLVKFSPSVLYTLSMTYCRNNFFLISITILCIVLNNIMLLLIKKES